MEKFTVVFKRKKSPIAYFSALSSDIPVVEKIGYSKGEAVINIPVVKGSHFRGRFRRWLGREVILRNIDSIKNEKDFSKRVSVLTALFYSGSLTSGIKFKSENTFVVQKELFEVDKFGKYLGYMITGLDNKRSSFLIGHALPSIKGFNDTENAQSVSDENLKEITFKLPSGKVVSITEPLTKVISSRKAPIMKEVIETLGENEEVLEDLRALLSKQSKESKEKEDVQNLLYFEVINSGFDLVQEILIDGDEKDIVALLTAYQKFFGEVDRTIGGLSARGFGHLEGIIIENFTPNESALDEFIKSIDLKKITDLIIYEG